MVTAGQRRGRAAVGEFFSRVNSSMVFTLSNGKIARFREFVDSAALVRAFGRTASVQAPRSIPNSQCLNIEVGR